MTMRFQKALIAAAAVLSIAVPAAAMAAPYGHDGHDGGRFVATRHFEGERFGGQGFRGGAIYRGGYDYPAYGYSEYGYPGFYPLHHRFHRFEGRRW
jgi:hypothetical protein